jgi:F-type H+-transporting ATPase subunit epsilon
MPLPTHLDLEIVTPDRAVAHEEVDEVQLPGSEGNLGILPGHTPLLTRLRVGPAWFRKGTEITNLAIANGIAEVLPDKVRLLAQVAERGDEIDLDRAEEQRRRAEERLQAARTGVADIDIEKARVSLLKAMTRINVATKLHVSERKRKPGQ